MEALIYDIAVALGMGLLGALIFSAVGLVSGTDETTTIAPVTLLVVLLGVPPVGIFTFWLAAAVSKHMTHAIPTALLGIPGDTMAVPLMEQATALRNLGVPHIALRKMVSAALIAALIAVPLSVLFAILLAPFGEIVTRAAPWLFLAASILIAYFSPGRWASVALLAPFVLVILALQAYTGDGLKLSVSYFLGIAVGPLIADLFSTLSPGARQRMRRAGPRRFSIAPDVNSWSGYFPNPLRILDRVQLRLVTIATAPPRLRTC